jgi:hypothetical protein
MQDKPSLSPLLVKRSEKEIFGLKRRKEKEKKKKKIGTLNFVTLEPSLPRRPFKVQLCK